MKDKKEEGIRILRKGIERSVGREMRTPKDFAFLSDCIYARLNQYVSDTTLKRVWGYISGGETRASTLSLLASFLGYASWDEFLKTIEGQADADALPSGFMLGRHISVHKDLQDGQRLRLFWQPDRVCDVRYLGNSRFEVERSEKTRLQTGDTFSCGIIMEGEPLYIDSLRQGDRPETRYVCGSHSGIRYELL